MNPVMIVDSPAALKRRRFSTVDPMEADSAKAKLAAAKEKFGREIHVFPTITESAVSSDITNNEESEDFYEFTADDYFRLLAVKKEDKFLKTRKIREAEQAAQRSRITKALIRVRFPDNFTLEASFHPSETIQDLVNLLMKVIARPDLPFYLYTAPPKTQIRDMSQDFYSAGFVPGAIVYFSYNEPKGDDGACGQQYLQEEILSLQGLESAITEQAKDEVAPPDLPPSVAVNPTPQESKPAEKKNIKPKWLKM